jgi:hypothetical protein
VQLFDRWGINTLTFQAGVTEVGVAGLVLVLAREAGGCPDNLAALLLERGVRNIEVDLFEAGSSTKGVAPIEAYAAAVQVGKELREATQIGALANVRHVRHVTQAVVDQIMEDPNTMMALTTLKESDSCLISHSTNVAILSVRVGQRLGLSKARLGELVWPRSLTTQQARGRAGVLNKPGPLEPDEWEEYRPTRSRPPGICLRENTQRSGHARAVVAFEHHLNFDLSGYPRHGSRNGSHSSEHRVHCRLLGPPIGHWNTRGVAGHHPLHPPDSIVPVPRYAELQTSERAPPAPKEEGSWNKA